MFLFVPSTVSVTRKSWQMSIKVAQKWLSYKNERFRHLHKNFLQMWLFGQNNCCHRLWKVSQSALIRPIWSHCLHYVLFLSQISAAKISIEGGSHGLVVMGGGSCSKGCGFKSQCCILDRHDIFHIDLL